MNVTNINITEIENYIKTIFDLQKAIKDKDIQIDLLKFELALDKQLLENVKRFQLQLASSVK